MFRELTKWNRRVSSVSSLFRNCLFLMQRYNFFVNILYLHDYYNTIGKNLLLTAR